MVPFNSKDVKVNYGYLLCPRAYKCMQLYIVLEQNPVTMFEFCPSTHYRWSDALFEFPFRGLYGVYALVNYDPTCFKLYSGTS